MPSTSALQSLFSKQQISNEKWFELLEERRLLLKPYLDKVTLGILGRVGCIQSSYGGNHTLFDDNTDHPLCEPGHDLDLGTQGIFMCSYGSRELYPGTGIIRPYDFSRPNGHLYIGGLVRKACWILARVNFVGVVDYKGRVGERAISVLIEKADLPTIVSMAKVTPYEIWQTLGREVAKWEEQRKWLYEEMRRLNAVLERDSAWLELAVSR